MHPMARWIVALLPPLVVGLVAAPTPTADAAPAPAVAHARVQCHRTLPSYPTLRPGDRGRAVRTLQCSLNDLGLDVGPVVVDGSYGPQTKRAVRENVDGFEGEPAHPYRVNNGFWVLLFGRQLPDHQLVQGDQGHDVVVLQRALRAAGAVIVVDGDFGPETKAVVKQYQGANDIAQTGRVDARTRFLLGMGGVIGELN